MQARADLSRAFVESYVAQTGDRALQELLPFYTCYRACVRGKVLSFQLDEPEVPEAQRELARGEASALFSLAASYASGPTQPTLLMLGGLMGTGKSSLAYQLHRESGWTLFSSDMIRKHLAQLHPSFPRADIFGEGLYSPEWSARTYASLYKEASTVLAKGRSALLDASFLRKEDRLAVAHEAVASGANVLFVECVCPPEIALQRLTQRWQVRMEREQAIFTEEEAYLASDGRPDLYESQHAAWQAFDAEEEQHDAAHSSEYDTTNLYLC